jgi:LEA14-like dessication related protein
MFFGALLFISACSSISKITQTLTNLQRLQFKLENVNDFALAGVKLSNKKSINDFSITDGLKLTQAFTSKSLPTRFVLNVAAKNPNDGTGGSKQAGATLTSFDWQLYIDDVPTIKGNIASPIEVPGTGQTTIIPLVIEIDLYKFFKDKGYDGLLNLALALGGVEGSAARLKLDAKPTVQTDFGPLTYPGRITIVDTKFSS